jgi:hypothetical protein
MYTPPLWKNHLETVTTRLNLPLELKTGLEEVYGQYLTPGTLSPALERILMGASVWQIAWTAKEKSLELAQTSLEVLLLLTQLGCAFRKLELAGVLHNRYSSVMWRIFCQLSGQPVPERHPLERPFSIKRVRA